MASSDRSDDLLVDPAWIAQHLDDPSVRFVEVDVSPAAYAEGHVPGARALERLHRPAPSGQLRADRSARARSTARGLRDHAGVHGRVLRVWPVSRVLAARDPRARGRPAHGRRPGPVVARPGMRGAPTCRSPIAPTTGHRPPSAAIQPDMATDARARRRRGPPPAGRAVGRGVRRRAVLALGRGWPEPVAPAACQARCTSRPRACATQPVRSGAVTS